MYQHLIAILLSLISLWSIAQGGIITDGSNTIVIENGATVYVEGDVKLEQNSIIASNGDLWLKGNWENNSSTNAFDPTVTDGNVHFFGGNQLIQGLTESHFYNLYLYGENLVKECLVDVAVNGELHLTNTELQTHDNTVAVNNPAENAVTFDKGYVASDLLGGYFARATNSTNDYQFPTGNRFISFSNRLRPITLKPTQSTPNVFAVRLAPLSPNNDVGTSITNAIAPYPISNKQVELTELNELFYHNIARLQGNSPTNVTIWYEKEDGEFNTVAHWIDKEKWMDENFEISSTSSALNPYYPLQKATQLNYNDFTNDAFVLATIFKIENIYIPNTFTPNNDFDNDLFLPAIAFDEIVSYKLTIFDRWGKRIFISGDKTEGWNGNDHDKACETGTYIWTLKIKPDANNANFIERIGHINLIR